MKRREFIQLGGSVGLLLAVQVRGARGQQPATQVIGYLTAIDHESPSSQFAHLLAAFRQGLSTGGFSEGKNLSIEFRAAQGQYERLPELAADLVRRRVDVIFASAPNASLAAKAATATIPVVFAIGYDPVEYGLVTSLNRPGGNVTGATFFAGTLVPKRLELLRELLHGPIVIGMLVNPDSPASDAQLRDAVPVARALGWELRVENVRSGGDFDTAFQALKHQGVTALLVAGDSNFMAQRGQLAATATRHLLPAIYDRRDFVESSGLMSYGTSVADTFRKAGIYVARILKGEKPADLPILQPAKFELVINLKTAKVLALEVPPTLLARADEVIE